METVIVIGLGEVGRPLYETLKASNTYVVYGYDVRSEISPSKLSAELAEIAEFIVGIHEVLYDRSIFYPDYIGGRYLIPSTRLLDSIDHNTVWRFVLESNEKRLEELKDEKVKRDVEVVRGISARLFPAWYFE